MQLAPAEMAGVHYFRQEHCSNCHNVTGDSPKTGPNLLNTSKRHDSTWLMAHFKMPAAVTPGSVMTPVNLSDAELKDLLALMLRLTPENGDVVNSAPDFATEGALIFQKNGCGGCHSVNGVGGKIGPVLNGLAGRHNETWVIQHFQDPQKMSPDTPMPPYKFSDKQTCRTRFPTSSRCPTKRRANRHSLPTQKESVSVQAGGAVLPHI